MNWEEVIKKRDMVTWQNAMKKVLNKIERLLTDEDSTVEDILEYIEMIRSKVK